VTSVGVVERFGIAVTVGRGSAVTAWAAVVNVVVDCARNRDMAEVWYGALLSLACQDGEL
jgi:hypothetical protein